MGNTTQFVQNDVLKILILEWGFLLGKQLLEHQKAQPENTKRIVLQSITIAFTF